MSQRVSKKTALSTTVLSRCMSAYTSAFLQGTLTNFTRDKGRYTATDIDHIFVRCHQSIASNEVLLSPSSHAFLRVELEPAGLEVDSWSCKFIHWQRALPGDIKQLASVLGLLWGWMAMMLVLPNMFLRLLWKLAAQFIPVMIAPKTVTQFLQSRPTTTSLKLWLRSQHSWHRRLD